MTPVLNDPESGLLNGDYFRASVPNRVATARRLLRPLSVVLLTTGDSSAHPTRCQPEEARIIAETLLRTLRESDIPCRLEDGGFGLILEDTPENGAVWTIERLRRLLVNQGIDLTIWAGIAAYPAHALEANELMLKAQQAMAQALEWAQSRIEVAVPE